MSIHFISGKPGGGKSLYAMKLILEELVTGHRPIITNLPIRLGALNEYVQKTYPQADSVCDRIWILNDEQTGHFWTYRPEGVRIPMLTKEQWRNGEKPSYAGVKDKGVFYAIDEIHNYFGARQWADTGQDVLYYLSQHRKLSDTVLCITQAIQNVDKQFRSVTQDFTFLRNLAKERYGLFKLPGVFSRKTFPQPPAASETPMETGVFKLDVSGIASCYDSAVGVGIHGKGADMNEKRRGIPWGWAIVFTAVMVIGCFFFLPKLLAHFFTTPMRVALQPGKVASLSVVSHLGAASNEVQRVSAPVRSKFSGVRVTGISAVPGAAGVCLSDGRILRLGDHHLQVVGKDWVVIDGVRYEVETP